LEAHGEGEGVNATPTGWWLVVALLAGGCSTSTASQGAGSDQADVWFMQHMVPHLLQTTAMVDLAGDRITRPKLARLAATIGRQGQADLEQLQGWLADRGLPSYDPSVILTAAARLICRGCPGCMVPASISPSEGHDGPAPESAAHGRVRGPRWWPTPGPGASARNGG
jgi:hypothetical protein